MSLLFLKWLCNIKRQQIWKNLEVTLPYLKCLTGNLIKAINQTIHTRHFNLQYFNITLKYYFNSHYSVLHQLNQQILIIWVSALIKWIICEMILILIILNFAAASKNIYIIENSLSLLTDNQSKFIGCPRLDYTRAGQ